MEKRCNLCNESLFEKIYKKSSYNLLRCKKCSLIFVYPQPTDKELASAYSYKSGYFEYTDFPKGKLNPFFENIFRKMKNGMFLDVGCGTGYALYTAKACGWNEEGIDLNKDAIARIRKMGLNAVYANIDNFSGKNGKYDIINMGDLIEHVKNPEKTIRKAYALLKKNGKLIISTPNINSFFPKYSFLISKIFGITWSHPSPPYHLFEFSNNNLPKFLKQEGFRIEKILYSNISLEYSIGNTGMFKKFKDEYRKNNSLFTSAIKNNPFNNLLMATAFALYLPGYIISKYLKIKDEMTLILKK